MKTKINEIFTSIQGEGILVGYKQLFIRFCGCNLKCNYCDTDFFSGKEYSVDELVKICNDNSDCHSVSLTGGEPLLHKDFLKEFIQKSPLPIYLETNATLYDNLDELIENIDYVSADIKLPSCTGVEPLWEEHEKFFDIARKSFLFVKLVFDSNISEYEIIKTVRLVSKYNVELILQPKMNGVEMAVSTEVVSDVLNKFLKMYSKTRVIPQVHKFIGVE